MINMQYHAKKIRSFVFSVLFCAALTAQETAAVPAVRFTADPRIPKDAVSGGVMDAGLFIQTALIASGASDESIPLLIGKLDDAYKLISAQLPEGSTAEFCAEQSLFLLYKVLLSSYSETQTLIDTALRSGVYNCVSSDVLFMYLMKREGIPVTAVETPLHAFCTVTAGGREVDVETTNPYGFDPGVKKELYGSSSVQKRYVTVPAKNYVKRHNVDDRRIISLIYNNRMSELQKQKNDHETIGLSVDAMILQNNAPQAVETLYQCVYNTAVDYSDEEKDEDGLALIKQAGELFGDSPVYHAYTSAAVAGIINRCMNRTDYDGAFAALEQYRIQLEDADYKALYEEILVNSLNHAVVSEPFADALAEINKNRPALSENEYQKLSVYAYSNEAVNTADTGAWLDAVSVLDKGLLEFPGNGTLSKQRSVYRRNYAAEVHNKAAALFNAGDREGARNVVQKGLEQVSDSSILLNDLKRLQQ